MTANVPGGTITWSSGNASIAEVNSSGLVLAKSVGAVMITATSGSASDSVRVTVTHGPVASVQIGGSGRTLTAILRDAAGHVLTDREVVWASSAPDVVDVDEQTGELMIRQPGRAIIVANSEGVTDEVGINVSAQQEPVASIEIAPGGFPLDMGDRILMAVELRSADGELLTDREVTWVSDNPDVVSVDERGMIEAKASGQASITATSEGVSVTETFTVKRPQIDYQLLYSESPGRSNPQPLQGAATFGEMHIFTSPDEGVSSVTFFVNDPEGNSAPIKTESAAPYDMLGTRADGTAQTLDASQVTPNSYTITAEIVQTDGNPVSISSTFTVLPVPVDSVAITPDSATVEEGQTIQLSATATDADGNVLDDRDTTWASGNRDVAEVDSTGLVRGIAEGVTTISAEVDGVTASIPVSVTSSQVTFALKVVSNPVTAEDATNPANHQPLHDASLFGDVVIFVEPQENISSVTYRIDDFESADFAPDDGILADLGASILISARGVTTQSLGPHSVIAEVTSTEGETVTLGAVYNAVLPPVASVDIVMQPITGGGSGIIDPDIDDLQSFPAPESIPVGFGTALYAIVTDALGNFVQDRHIEWETSNEQVASLVIPTDSSNGGTGYTFYGRYFGNNGQVDAAPIQHAQVKGESVGPVTITATAEGVSTSVDMNVHMPFQSTGISTNGMHTCAITFEGDAYCWGLGEDGQLGYFPNSSVSDETTESRSTPGLVPMGFRFSKLSVNSFLTPESFHTCGISNGGYMSQASGQVICWGNNEEGQIGDGSTGVGPSLGFTELRQFSDITSGGSHSCGLMGTFSIPFFDDTGSNAFCWGNNLDGQLGDGTGVSKPEPEEVAGGVFFSTLSAGANHTCGTTSNREAYCWGDNSSGQLGIGSITADQLEPQLVSSELGFYVISAGMNHSCGIHTGSAPNVEVVDDVHGEVYCWGNNEFGQLGNGTTDSQAAPSPVSGDHIYTVLKAGPTHTCGVTIDRQLYCWGSNESGQLGDGTTDDSLVPVLAAEGMGFNDVAVGQDVTCALSALQRIFCWGSGTTGALGTGQDGEGYVELLPAPVSNIPQFVHLSTGRDSACALNSQGKAFCWGQASFGRLGTGNLDDETEPSPVSGNLTFQTLDNGTAHTCGIDIQGDAYCWGLNFNGQVGNGTEENQLNPAQVQGDVDFVFLSAGEFHTCGIDIQGNAYCWGFGGDGQLGNGQAGDEYEETEPVPVNTELRFTSISAGGRHTCGLTRQGEAYCWGDDSASQRGDGLFDFFDLHNITDDDGELDDGEPSNPNAIPKLVVGDHVFKQISAGLAHTCGVTVEGEAYCWGEGDDGRLGIGSTDDRSTPTLVSEDLHFVSISSGDSHTCAVTQGGDAYCWGNGDDFRLGSMDAPGDDQAVPVPVSTDPFVLDFRSVSAHGPFTCGISSRSTAVCWGSGFQGQLGNGSTEASAFPITVNVPE